MRTSTARALHLALFLTGTVLYVVFVLPRWWVLTGDIPSTLATAGRIAAGIPIALAALPVLQIVQAGLRSKPPAPEIAQRLRAWSVVLHVVAGVLILLAAIVEIWLRLETGGPWLFAVYGAAGSIAVLAFLALYLSFVAEKPPAAPKPPKPAKAKKVKAQKVKAQKKPRGKKKAATTTSGVDAGAETVADEPETTTAVTETAVTETAVEETEAVVIEAAAEEAPDATPVVSEPEPAEAEPANDETSSSGALRNKRPAGKRHRLRR